MHGREHEAVMLYDLQQGLQEALSWEQKSAAKRSEQLFMSCDYSLH
jgi:hypothetical protein